MPFASIAQQLVSISGTVTDTEGISLPGVTININNHKIFITDNEGKFTFSDVNMGDTLYIKHISYKPIIQIIDSSTIFPLQIILESKMIMLDEVVFSTGYEHIPRERATGSFEQLDSVYINRNPSSNILSRMKNTITGIYFDQSRTNFNNSGKFPKEVLNIHGISSIQGSNEPLIILDNFPFSGDINSLNPNDIADITVLKDAAASSIWGAQAGNGVIVITTKKATNRSPIKVEAHLGTLIVSKPDLFYRKTIANKDLIDVQSFLYGKGFYNSPINSRSKPILPMSVEVLEKVRKELLSPSEGEALLDLYSDNDIRNDMLEHLYRPAVNQQYALSFSGGSDNNSFRISTGLDKSISTQVTSENSRFTLRAYDKISFSPSLEFDMDVLWSRMENEQVNLIEYYNNSGYPHPYLTLQTLEGMPATIPYGYSQGYLEEQDNGNLLDWLYRPLEEMHHNLGKEISNSLITTSSVSYRPHRYFGLNFRYRNELIYSDMEQTYDKYSIQSRNFVNLFTQVSSEGEVIKQFPEGGILEFGNNKQVAHQGRAQIDFKLNDKPNHSIYALIGVEASKRKSRNFTDVLYGYDEEKMTYATQVDYFNRYQTYNNLGSTSFIPSNLSRNRTNNRYVSLFGNGAYTLFDRYTVSASYRKDASNIFGMSTNDKWNPLWSTGLSWAISKEPFFRVPFVEYLKLRSTFGFSGNIDPSRSANTTINYSTINAIWGISWPSAQILVAPNPSLRWEKIRNLNFGLDFSMSENRFSGSVDVYWKKSQDLIHLYPLDPTVGLISQAMNVADAQGRGIDVRLSSVNFNRSFKWRTDFLFTYNNNWIKKTYVDYPGASSLVSSSFVAYEGAMPFGLYSYKFAGLIQRRGTPRFC